MSAAKIHEKSGGGLLARLLGAFAPSAPKDPQTDPKPLREAAGANVDADDDQWRRLTGDGQRDLAPMTQDRMQRLAHYQWETNLLANRLIELPVAYLLAGGVRLTIEDEDAQAVLNRHWNDGLNAWDLKLPKRARELALFGEQCFPVFRDPNTGFVRLGYLDPALIATVVTDPENREQPIGVVTKRDKRGNVRRYRIIVNVPESAFAAGTRKIRETFTDGECFFYRVNDLSSATRGRSDLLAQIDWLDAYDQFLFGELDGTAFRRAFVWDVTLTGASPEEVTEKAKKITAPKPGSVRVHNENEQWEPKAPDLQAADSAEGARLFRNQVLGGATLPEHWYGGGGDVNRSTGESMSEPTEKVLLMRQSVLGYMLTDIGRYVVRSAWDALDRELKPEEADLLGTLTAAWPEMTNKDITKYAASLGQIVAAIAGLLEEGLVTRATALRLVTAVADRLGVEIDVDDELDKATKELANRGGNDLLGMPLRKKPPVPPPAPVDPSATAA